MIKAANITKCYFLENPQKVKALDNVNCHVTQGSWTTITGPSGSGKSTLLALMAALDRPTSGQILIKGQDISFASDVAQARYRKEQIGIVFQEFQLLENLNAVDNVAMPLVVTAKSRKERRRQAQVMLAELGLSHRTEHLPRQLSGGERQLVAISRALIQHPEIIFADEPSSNIDQTTANKVLSLFNKLVDNGRTLVIVSHDPRLVECADQVITLNNGEVVA